MILHGEQRANENDNEDNTVLADTGTKIFNVRILLQILISITLIDIENKNDIKIYALILLDNGS
jgi:hypothetical protein